MKKNICVVPGCTSTDASNDSLKFHQIPKDAEVRKKWLKAINRTEPEINKKSRVCSKHFKNQDYAVTRFNYMGAKNAPSGSKNTCEIKALKNEAVPNLLLPQKSTFKIKISKKDSGKQIKVEEVKVKEEKVDKPEKVEKAEKVRMPKRPAVEMSPPRARTQSRRAASKEALKQMQLLLDDENDAVEIPDDDYFLDIIPIDPTPPPPPKKKYKLSHRKSSDGNDRDVIVLKTITNRDAENTLELDCWVEPLEESQKNRVQKFKDDEKEIQAKLDSLISQCSAKVIHKGDLHTIIEVAEQVQSAIQGSQAPPTSLILNNNMGGQQSYQLVMDPRIGLVVGAINNPQPPPPPPQKVYQGKVQVAQNLQQTPTPSPSTTPARGNTRTRNRSAAKMTPPPPPPVVTQTRTPVPQTRNQATPQTRGQATTLQTRAQATTPQTRAQATTPLTRAQATPPTRAQATPPTRAQATPPTRAQATPPTRAQATPPTRAQATPPTRAQATAPQTRGQATVPQTRTQAAAPQTRAQATPPQTRETRQAGTVQTRVQAKKVVAAVAAPPAPAVTTRGRGQPPANTFSSTVRPDETNVQGGLATGGKKVVVDLTADDTNRSAPDSREIAFNKLQGKTYPSLVVVARPHLRVQDLSLDRPKLDAKVKSVLMHAPTKFTEWLIQQGLIRSEQKCTAHATTQLKLGMYSDVSKFPYSGGYVWISECCPQRFVSVFSGSLFEGSPHPPLVILKLLYHWSCQTNIQNVTQWVKVDNLYVKGMFTWLRSICTVALHTHIRQIGGPGIKVEVGVISLGTTSQDGNQRQVKVEVLGVLESESKLIRLRAVEPQSEGDRNYKKRFSKILEPVCRWVHPQSILVADLTVDKQTLVSMGFQNVVQYSSNQYGNNNQIMEYLRRIVPRMFQNTLSLLSRQIIQQFLDELVWREWFGTSSLQAFDNLVTHLSEQTRFESGGQSLIVRLNKVAQNPFKSWAISVGNATKTVESTPTAVNATANKKQRSARKPEPPKVTTPTVVAQDARPPKSTSPDVPEHMVPLESYYYGTIDTYSKTPTITLNMKCPFCKSSFDNNIQLMSHLFKHAHNVSMDAQLCRYCLTSVATANDLLKHIATSHPAETKFDNGFCCLICETQYMNPFVLGKHMSKEHYPSELPYKCGTCSYRCSNHKQAIDHFYRTHDNGPTIQCPFCLKSTTVFTASRNIVQNMNYFIQHLQKHQRKQFARRCGKCNLWFVQKDVLKEHQNKMHVSQRGKNGLVPWTAPRNGIMVPKSKMDKYPVDAEVINFATLKFDLSTGLMCKECNTPMDTPKHFPSFESCQNPNCQYSTCCTNAMQEHNAKCSKTSNPISEGKLPFEMFCICGFSNLDGNQMARHLAICERKSAYPSRTDAQTATVTHSMLDVLGLVRRPEEKPKPQKSKKMKKDSSFDKTDEGMPDASVTKPTTTEEQKKDAEDTTKSKNLVKTNKKVMLDEDTSKKEVQIIDDDNKMDEGVANETAVVQNDTAAKDKEEEKMEVDDAGAKESIAIDKKSTEAKDEQTVDKEKDTVIADDKRDDDAEHKEITANKDTIDEEKVKDDLDENKEIEAEVKEPSQSKDLEEASNKTDVKSPESQSKDLEDDEENQEVKEAIKDKSEEQSIEKECEEDDDEKVSEKQESRVASPNKETEELKDDNRDTIDLDNDTKGSEDLEGDKKELDENEPETGTKEKEELADDPKESEELADVPKEREELADDSKESEELADDPKESEELADDPKESEELADDPKESEEHDNDEKETEEIECVTKKTEELESGTKETKELGDKKELEELEDDKIESESLGDDKIESESVEDDKIESESLGDDKIESESIGDDKIESESIEDDKKESSEPQADFENKESSENETEDVENDAEVLEDNHDKAPVVRSPENELEDYEEDVEKESEPLEKSDDKEPETLEDFVDKEPAVTESKDDEKESEDDEKESEDIDRESLTKSPAEKEDDEKESEDIFDRESLTKSPAEKEDDEDESEPQLDDFEEDKEPKDDVSSEKDIEDATKESEREPELESAEREPDLEPSEREPEDLDDSEKVAIDYRKEPESDLSNHVSEPETNMETSEMLSDKEPPAMTSDYIQNLLSDVARGGDETSVMETDGDGKQSDDVNMASPSEMMDVPDVGGDAPTPMETD